VFWLSACIIAGPAFEYSFARGKWDPNDWMFVKSPRWDHLGSWIQKESYIENHTPSNAHPADLLSTRAGETYTNMVLKKQFAGGITVSSTMEFTDQMAPLIVIASELGKDKKGRVEFREHFEVVIFDKGVNVWHHYFKDGKPSWKKVAYSSFALEPYIKYNVKVKIAPTRQGKMLSIVIGDHEFGYIDDSLPDKYYVGITGCEGINHFYNFTLEKEKR
jgi:hypothetical protein